MLALLQSQRTELELQIEAADALYRSGKTAQTDVFAARTELGLMDLKIQDTQALLDNAQAELQRWVGEQADAPLAGAVDLSQSRLSTVDLFEQLRQHPEVLALDKAESMALAEAEVKQQEKSADWTLSVMYAGRGPEFSEMLSFGASRPLFVDQDNRQNQALAAANAMAAKAKAERIELHREQLAQTKRWQQTWQSNLKRVADFDRSLIPLTQQRTQAALSAYQGPRAPWPRYWLRAEWKSTCAWKNCAFKWTPRPLVGTTGIPDSSRGTTMKKTHIAVGVLALAALAGGGYGLWALGMNQGIDMMSAPIGGANEGGSNEGDGGQVDPSTWNIPQGEAATRRHMESGIKAGDVDPETGLAVQYYHDPMVPGRKFDSPGKSPFMDAVLGARVLRAPIQPTTAALKVSSPHLQQNLGIRARRPWPWVCWP